MSTFKAVGLAAKDTSGVLERYEFERREPLEHDVLIETQFCGICHSDLHQIRAEWEQTVLYPMIPGHEIAGIVRKVGSAVTKFKVGDHVGVGCMVDSCRDCDGCRSGNEQYCRGNASTKNAMHGTYNCCVKDENKIHIRNSPNGELLFGGYSSHVTVDENYVLSIPESIPLESAGPLLCAGITMYSPLVHYGQIARISTKEKEKHPLKVGIVGFGGLGHMGVQIAKAMGHVVTVISRSERKRELAKKMGADDFIVSTDKQSMKAHENSLQLIIDTVSGVHDISPFLSQLLVTSGVVCLVGIPPEAIPVKPFDVIGKRKMFGGSCIGGITETQEMLDFCGKHNLIPHVELIDAKEVNQKLHLLSQNQTDANRYVIRIAETLTPQLGNGSWKPNAEPAIDPSTWVVNPGAKVVPSEANIHTKLSAGKSGSCKCSKGCGCEGKCGGNCKCGSSCKCSGGCKCSGTCKCINGCKCGQSCKCTKDCGCGGKCGSNCKCGSSCKCSSSCGCGGKCGGNCKCGSCKCGTFSYSHCVIGTLAIAVIAVGLVNLSKRR